MGKPMDPAGAAERKMRRLRASLPDEVPIDPQIKAARDMERLMQNTPPRLSKGLRLEVEELKDRLNRLDRRVPLTENDTKGIVWLAVGIAVILSTAIQWTILFYDLLP